MGSIRSLVFNRRSRSYSNKNILFISPLPSLRVNPISVNRSCFSQLEIDFFPAKISVKDNPPIIKSQTL